MKSPPALEFKLKVNNQTWFYDRKIRIDATCTFSHELCGSKHQFNSNSFGTNCFRIQFTKPCERKSDQNCAHSKFGEWTMKLNEIMPNCWQEISGRVNSSIGAMNLNANTTRTNYLFIYWSIVTVDKTAVTALKSTLYLNGIADRHRKQQKKLKRESDGKFDVKLSWFGPKTLRRNQQKQIVPHGRDKRNVSFLYCLWLSWIPSSFCSLKTFPGEKGPHQTPHTFSRLNTFCRQTTIFKFRCEKVPFRVWWLEASTIWILRLRRLPTQEMLRLAAATSHVSINFYRIIRHLPLSFFFFVGCECEAQFRWKSVNKIKLSISCQINVLASRATSHSMVRAHCENTTAKNTKRRIPRAWPDFGSETGIRQVSWKFSDNDSHGNWQTWLECQKISSCLIFLLVFLNFHHYFPSLFRETERFAGIPAANEAHVWHCGMCAVYVCGSASQSSETKRIYSRKKL